MEISIPSLLLSFALASVYGLVFYIVLGRGWFQLAVYWLTALLGFALGELISRLAGFSLFPIGQVSVVEASVASWIALFIARELSRWWTRQHKPA